MNKDGSVYRLRGPNPLMKEQEVWNMDKIVIHNFGWEPITIPDQKPAVILPKEDPITVVVIQEPPPVVEVTPIVPVPVIEQPKVEVKPVEKLPPSPKNSVRVHCLPGFIKVYKDVLYAEERKTISYGDKFEFDATVIDKSDLSIIFWSARKSITEGSILYPQTGHARWWRVKEIEDAGIGIRILGEPSDYQPSF